jgi:hypothetical protein
VNLITAVQLKQRGVEVPYMEYVRNVQGFILCRMKAITDNVIGLGKVAFVRWLVCRKAILPNLCYKPFIINN